MSEKGKKDKQDEEKTKETVDHNAEQTDGGKDPGHPENEAAAEKLDEAREGADGEQLDEDAPARTPAEAAAQDKEFDDAAAPSGTVAHPAADAALTAIGETSGVDEDGNADPDAKVVNGE